MTIQSTTNITVTQVGTDANGNTVNSTTTVAAVTSTGSQFNNATSVPLVTGANQIAFSASQGWKQATFIPPTTNAITLGLGTDGTHNQQVAPNQPFSVGLTGSPNQIVNIYAGTVSSALYLAVVLS